MIASVESHRPRCVDCRTESPVTDSSYALISPSHGWRVVRVEGPDGTTALNWRCAPCWKRYKEAAPRDEISAASRRPMLPTQSGRFAAVAAGQLFEGAAAKLREDKDKKR